MMMRRTDHLFAENNLDAVLRGRAQRIPELVGDVPRDQFLASSDDELVEYFLSEFRVEPLVIYEDRMEREQSETKVDVTGRFDWDPFPEERRGPKLVPGTEVKVFLPFTGDAELWKLKPNPCRLSFPYATVVQPRAGEVGSIVFTVTKTHGTAPEEYKKALDKQLDDVRDHLKNQQAQIETFNAALPKDIQQAVNTRRKRLEEQDVVAKALDIPLRRRGEAAPIEPIRLKEKIVRPLPPPPESAWKPEPGIDEKNYENVLKIIRHQGRTFETTPATYKVHDEEELRDMVVANLNIYLEGEGGGETFRKSGKTDICVKEGDRAAFVAECAVWRGEKHLLGKTDQLLDYLTWRDCKAALIIFNKEVAGFAELLNKVPVALARHRFLVKNLGQQGEGEWRYVFRSAEDEGRRITVHVFWFDLLVK